MKNNPLRIATVIILISLFLIGCTSTPQGDQTQLIETDNDATPAVEEVLTEEDVSNSDIDIEISRFTIKADVNLQGELSALYSAYFDGESPVFVMDDPDLLVTAAPETAAERPVVYPTFLPDTILIPQIDNEDIDNFIQFAISPDGQQVLIEIGALPEILVITDQAGRQLEIHQPIRQVLSAYGPATAVIYSVNGWDRLVAASYLGARDPQGAEAMERIDPRFPELVGDDLFSQQGFDLEEAAALEPNLIIGASRSSWIESVEQLGVPVFLVEAETAQQLRETALLIGELFGPHSYAQAQAWVNYFDWVIDTIQKQLSENPMEPKPQVLFSGTEPLRIASGDMYQTEIIESAGGISVSAELSGYWNDVNLEQVVIWDPELIIIPPYGGAKVETITESQEWQIIDSVAFGQVFRMPKLVAPWDTPAPDSVLGIVWLAELLHPEIVELTCAAETNFFYNTFYNYAISGDEIGAICTLN